jgi:hypothetical protein
MAAVVQGAGELLDPGDRHRVGVDSKLVVGGALAEVAVPGAVEVVEAAAVDGGEVDLGAAGDDAAGDVDGGHLLGEHQHRAPAGGGVGGHVQRDRRLAVAGRSTDDVHATAEQALDQLVELGPRGRDEVALDVRVVGVLELVEQLLPVEGAAQPLLGLLADLVEDAADGGEGFAVVAGVFADGDVRPFDGLDEFPLTGEVGDQAGVLGGVVGGAARWRRGGG